MTNPTRKQKTVPKWLWIAAGVFAFLLLAAVVAPLFVPWDKVKTQAEETLSERLQHRVTVGKIGFNLFRGVEIRDLRVDNAQGFSPDPLLSDQAVIVKYRLLPLLLGKVVLKAIVLESPALVVEKAADGTFNFSDMLPAKGTGAEPETQDKESGKGKLPLDILISRVAITNASLTYRDLAKKQEYRIDDLNLQVSNLTLAGLTPVKVLLDAKLKALGSTIPFHLDAAWRFNYAKESFLLDHAEATLPGVALQAKGGVEQVLAHPTLGVSGSVALVFDRIQKELIPAELQAKLPKDFTMAGQGTIRFAVNGPAKQPEALAAEASNQIKVQIQAMGLNLPVSLDGGLNFKQANLALNEKLAVPGLDATLAVALSDALKARNVTADLKASLDLATASAKLVPPAAAGKMTEVKAKGQVDLEANVAGPLSQMDKLAITGQARAQAVSVDYQKQSLLDNVQAAITLAPERVALTSLSGKLAGQPLKASFSASGFDLRQPETLKPADLKARVQWNIESPLLDLDALMALASAGKPKPAAATPVAEKVPTPASTTAADKPEPVASSLMPAGLDLQGQATLGGLKFGKVTFGKLVYGMAIKQRILNNTLSLAGYKGQVQGQAKLDFTGKVLAYDIKADVKTVDVEPLLNDVLETYAATKAKKPAVIQEIQDKLVGRLSGSLTMNGRGMRPDAAKAALKGQGKFTLADGRMRKFSFQPVLAKLFGSDRFDQDIPFDQTVIEFTLADQIVNLTKFRLQSGAQGEAGDIRMDASGQITFEAEFKDFRLRPALSPRVRAEASPQFRQYSEVLKDDQGWTNIPVIMNGPMRKPDVQPDWEWMKNQLAGQVSKKAKSAVEDLGKKAREFLQKEQGKSSGEVQKDAAEELEKAKEKLKNLNLNNLFR